MKKAFEAISGGPPKILLSMSNIEHPRLGTITGDTDIMYSDQATAGAVLQAGGLPVYLPTAYALGHGHIDAYLDQADGVLMTGADTNVQSSYYGQERQSDQRVDSARDAADIALIRQAVARRKPIYGICKGMQVINVALGGSLHQNIAITHREVAHSIYGRRREFTHEASLIGGSILATIFNADRLGLNGAHGQAVKDLSPQLRASAIAADGIIEAYEGVDYPFLLGTQFHPELLPTSTQHAEIFKRFVQACIDG